MDQQPRPPTPADPSADATLLRRLVRWLPLAMAGHLFVGVPALLISLVVAFGTYEQARATQRMQQASTWPFVAVANTNYTPEGRHRVSLALVNNGLGPALLGPLELRYEGRAVRSPQELLVACCGYVPGATIQVATSPARDVALRPGERVSFFELDDVPANAAVLARLDTARFRIGVRSCYCSIFEECWIVGGVQVKPIPAPSCPTDWVRFSER